MATRTEDGSNTNNNAGENGEFKLDKDTGYSPESDAAFAKHLDIAIEAQDGKKPEPNTNTEAESGEQKPKAEEGDGKTKSGDRAGDTGDKSAQQQPNEKGKKKEERSTSAKDLKLEDGTTVKGGAERRFYEQREVARQERDHYKGEVQRIQNEANTLRQQMETLQQTVQTTHGMAPQELAIGARIVTDLKKDPVGTVKKLLAEVIAQGHTVEEIGSGIDVQAITRLIEDRMAPLKTQEGPSEEDITREAQLETQNFFTNHPDARPHDALIARVLRDNPALDLQGAYFQVKEAFAERGFDWSLTLEQNVNALSGESSQQQQQQDGHKAPLPNGGNNNSSSVVPNDKTSVVHEDTDMADIIKAAMRENGLNV
jgi:hypothetical protein